MNISLTALLVAIVLYTPYQIYLGISTGIPAINVLNLLVIFSLITMLRRPEDSGLPSAPFKWHFMLFFALMSVALFRTLMRGDGEAIDDLTYWKTVVFYPLLYFIFYHGVRDLRTARLVFFGIVFVAGVAALQGVRQGIDYGFGNFNETRRASGPFSSDWTNANRAGVYYAMFTPAFAVFALYMKDRYRLLRLIAVGCAVLGIVATFVTYSRQAYFILAVSLAVLFVKRSVVLTLLMIVAGINIQYWAPSAAVQRVEMTAQSDASSGEIEIEESAESRFIIWEGAWRMIQDHPLGVGLNRFKQEIGNYSPIKNMDAHNGYILTTAEASLIASVVLLTLLIRLAMLAAPLLRMDDVEAKILGFSFLLATIGFALGNVYGSTFYFGEVTGNYWAMAGIAARVPQLLHAAVALQAPSRPTLAIPTRRVL